MQMMFMCFAGLGLCRWCLRCWFNFLL